eukprot:5872374-Heterocapsa_arctica.AAC.1
MPAAAAADCPRSRGRAGSRRSYCRGRGRQLAPLPLPAARTWQARPAAATSAGRTPGSDADPRRSYGISWAAHLAHE